MTSLDALKKTLIELRRAVSHEIPLIIGGGFGLYLRQEAIRQSGKRTLLKELPEPRATNDIDLFLGMEILVNVKAVQELQKQIEEMKFEPVDGARFFQWIRTDGEGNEIKLDLLCGPIKEYKDQLHTKSLPRDRPKAPKELLRFHARETDEAIELDSSAIPFKLHGQAADGNVISNQIFIPHPFTYLMMKLFAFDDRKEDKSKDVGRHHAMDLYRVIAMMTEQEYEASLKFGKTYKDDQRFGRARQIVGDYFAEPSRLGTLRIKEHPLYRSRFETEKFISVLGEILNSS